MSANRRSARSRLSAAAAGLMVMSLVMAGSSRSAFAGTAPPTRSPGAAIAPDPSSAEAATVATSVTLVSQTVEFVVEPPASDANAQGAGSQGEITVSGLNDESVRARVNSNFVLRNSSRSEVSLNLGFPLNDLSGIKDANGNLPVVEGFTVNAGGAPIDYALTARTNPYGEGEPSIQWATFPVSLPARADLSVDTGYTTTATGQWPIAQFNYSLETASAWQGRIGTSEIVLRLPYTATAENVFLSESTSGGAFDGAAVRWSRRNLEASAQNNFEVSILAPKVWQQILAARAAVAQTPDSTDAWVALGRAYRAAVALDNGVPLGGTRQFVPLAEQAYEKAIELNPNVAEIHQEYAQLTYDLRIAEDLNTARALPQLEKIVDHVQTALQLDPSNPATADLLLNVKQLVQDLAARQPSAQVTALADQIATIEAMVVASAPMATDAPVAPESTAVVTDTAVTGSQTAGAAPTMSAEEQSAVVAAQSTVAAAAVLTTTPSAPEATAIAGAVATVGARETVVAGASSNTAAVAPTMSAEEQSAVGAAQSTVAAAAVLTTTPSAPEATAIAGAVATVGARETVVAGASTGPAAVAPTMSAEEQSAVVAAQSTVAAAAVLTTTPSAPEATAIAGAVATVGARETVVALSAAGGPNAAITETPLSEPVVVTAEATADAAVVETGTPGARDIAAVGTPAGAPQTLVARLGLLAVIGIACSVIIVLGVLAAILVALFGRRRAAKSAADASNTKGDGAGAPPAPPKA